MSKFLFLLVGVIVLSKTDGTLISSKSSLTPDDSEEQFNVDDWSELDVVYPYSESFRVPEKRPNRDALMRRSTLDKNFMRFGRSGFFPGERCCRQKDLVGFADDYSSDSDPISLTKTGTDSNFMRFGRGGNDNFMRFGRGGDNFMRFGRPEKDKGNFMRFGRGGSDNFMRFGRGGGENFMRFGRSEKDKGNFMRFGRDDRSNFMRFGRGGDDNFMRFGRDDRNNFMRFGRGKDDNFIRFGRGDDISRDSDETEEQFFRPAKNDQFIRFGKSPMEFVRYGKSDGKDSFIRFGKSGRNGTNFIRIGLESEEDGDGAKKDSSARRKRTTSEVKSSHERRIRNPEMMEDVLPETRRSSIEENVTKPNILKFISLINRNRPGWEAVEMKSFFPPAQSNPVLKPDPETKRKQDGSGFIRFG